MFHRWIGSNITDATVYALRENFYILRWRWFSFVHIFQLIEDYHTLKRPDLLKSSQKTQLSLEIDGKLHSEKKVHLFISYMQKSRCKLLGGKRRYTDTWMNR